MTSHLAIVSVNGRLPLLHGQLSLIPSGCRLSVSALEPDSHFINLNFQFSDTGQGPLKGLRGMLDLLGPGFNQPAVLLLFNSGPLLVLLPGGSGPLSVIRERPRGRRGGPSELVRSVTLSAKPIDLGLHVPDLFSLTGGG